MLFERGQKFHVKNAEFFITIEGGMSGAQGIHKAYPNENHYNVDVNGSKFFISESQLLHWLQSTQPEKEPEKPKEEPKPIQPKPEEIIEKTKVKEEKKGGRFPWQKK